MLITTVFQWGDEVRIVSPGRNCFPSVPNVSRIEELTVQDLPGVAASHGVFSISEVREVEFQEHQIQRSTREQGFGEIPSELLAANHIALLLELAREAAPA